MTNNTPTEQPQDALRPFTWLSSLSEAKRAQIAKEIEWLHVKAGQTLFEEGDDGRELYLVSAGCLGVYRENEQGELKRIAIVEKGEYVGEFQLLAAGRRSATVKAEADSLLGRWPHTSLERWLSRNPHWLISFSQTIQQRVRANQLREALVQIFGEIREEVWQAVLQRVEWRHLQRGEILFEQDTPSDGVYLVISGRLRVERNTPDGQKRMLGEIGRGELVGEVAFFSNTVRAGNVFALRDSSLVRFSESFFEGFLQAHPHQGFRVMQAAVRRLRANIQPEAAPRHSKNLAILLLDRSLSAAGFSRSLGDALAQYGGSFVVDRERIGAQFGDTKIAQLPPEDPYSLRVDAWLTSLANQYRFVLLLMDGEDSAWTRRCLRLADSLLIVSRTQNSPNLRPIESKLEQLAPPQEIERRLILIHPKDAKQPQSTAAWLAARHIDAHHHLRERDRADVARLARFLAGEAVGLVLSGGGARGFAHYPIYHALRNAGIHIDAIGGTSMGSVVGAQCLLAWDKQEVIERNLQFLVRQRPFQEYTLPFMSLVRSRRLDRVLLDTFQDTQIEDLWLPFFAVSSNLTTQSLHIHKQGLLRHAVRASTAIPGLVLPAIEDQQLLIDGGLLNNLPVDVMRKSCKYVIAVDVGEYDRCIMPAPAFPSPWRFLWQKLLNRFRSPVPSIIQILLHATQLSSLKHAQLMAEHADICLRPPVDDFALLDFSSIHKILERSEQFIANYLQEHPFHFPPLNTPLERNQSNKKGS
jgi:predicted acylesterase/phospholipase RssA/CRP-like cAMP-binding protein